MTKSPLFSFTLFFPYLEERRKKKAANQSVTRPQHTYNLFFSKCVCVCVCVCVRAFFLSAKFQREDQEVKEEGKENDRACFGVRWSRSTGTGKEHSSLGCYYCFPSLHASQKKKKKKRKHLITEQKQLKKKVRVSGGSAHAVWKVNKARTVSVRLTAYQPCVSAQTQSR